MRLGYSLHGFLGDVKIEDGKEVSTPDGNAAYSWSILWEAQRRGHETVLMQRDRDAEAYAKYGDDIFSAFSRDRRASAYVNSLVSDAGGLQVPLDALGDLDVLLIEWRWTIPGRNTEQDRGTAGYQPDLARQCELLRHYKKMTGTKVVLWDLDHKLTAADEAQVDPDAILETSVRPRESRTPRIRVEPPVPIDDIMQMPTLPADPKRKAVYVGSRYERDDVIEKWMKPVSDAFPFEVEFWGNWTREPNLSECREMWPNILYCDRIAMKDFRRVYGTAVSCPLLAKRTYLECGFVTPRIWEALMFGTLPVGLGEHFGVEQYATLVAGDPQDLVEHVDWMSHLSLEDRHALREMNAEKIAHMDVKNFVDTLEEIARS